MQNLHGVEPPKKPRISGKKVGAIVVSVIVIIGIAGYFLFRNSAGDLLRQGSAVAVESWNDLQSSSSGGEIVSEIENSGGSAASSPSVQGEAGATSSSVPDDARGVVSAPAGDVAPSSSNTAQNESVTNKGGNTEIMGVVTLKDDPSAASGFAPMPVCSTSSIVASSRRVILNEIAWMGSAPQAGETATQAANREWIELRNISGAAVDLDGWQVANASGKLRIIFGGNETMAANGFLLASRDGVSVAGISPDKTYSGALANTGDKLFIFDRDCGVSDVLDASAKWPGGDNTTKQTLERKSDLAWQTSTTPGGTPRAENSAGVPPVVVISSSTEKYDVNVAIAGDGGGRVAIKPGTVTCKTSCTNQYAKGMTVTLTAEASSEVSFAGWSGGCAGSSGCSFVVGGPVSVVATFRLDTDDAAVTDSDSSTTNIPTSTVASGGTDDDQNSSTSSVSISVHLLIAAVQIAGASSSNDFVKIYNPTAGVVDLGGWKLRKRSSTGGDASLREFPTGSSIAPGGYFVWANNTDGFAESINADASSTGTLAANNSVALFDENGTQIDAVAWGTGTGQYVEGTAYPDSPTANQVLRRKSANGVIVDTNNNANDFTL